MRMYGRENSEVVRPTNAVSATKNTLNASMKNCSRRAMRLPCATILAVSAQAARNVTSEKTTLSSGAKRRWPNTPSSSAPSSGVPTSARNSMLLLLLQGLEVLQIEAVELLANLEEEHAEDQHRHQHVERDAEFDDHRHAVGRAHRREEQAVLHRQESDHLRHRLAAGDHRQEGDQYHRHRDADGIAGRRARERGYRLR